MKWTERGTTKKLSQSSNKNIHTDVIWLYKKRKHLPIGSNFQNFWLDSPVDCSLPLIDVTSIELSHSSTRQIYKTWHTNARILLPWPSHANEKFLICFRMICCHPSIILACAADLTRPSLIITQKTRPICVSHHFEQFVSLNPFAIAYIHSWRYRFEIWISSNCRRGWWEKGIPFSLS